MNTCRTIFLTALATLLTLPAVAETREEKRIAEATDVVDQLLRIPEQGVPPSLLARAYAVAVIPDVVKLGFGLGARRGKVDGIASGKLTLGADASIAAGPVGRHTEVATDIQFEAEVYSYSRSRGLFAGVSLEGSGVTIDDKANAAFYGRAGITADQVFASSGNMAPAAANNFVQVLSAQPRRLPQQPGMDTGISSAAPGEPRKSSVRTFGMGDPDEPETR